MSEPYFNITPPQEDNLEDQWMQEEQEDLADAGSEEYDASEPAPLLYPTLTDFVEEFIAYIYERPIGNSSGARWCPQWWTHDEAVFRLTALWQAWEGMRVDPDPASAAKWLAYFADPIMGQLMAPGGVFDRCSSDRGHDTHPPHPEGHLPFLPPPINLMEPRQ